MTPAQIERSLGDDARRRLAALAKLPVTEDTPGDRPDDLIHTYSAGAEAGVAACLTPLGREVAMLIDTRELA